MRGWIAGGVIAAFALGCVSSGGGAQPNMRAALEHLRAARAELTHATPRKGGHRGRAIALVDRAIEQVQRGIEFDATH